MKRAICNECGYETEQWNTFGKVSNQVWEDGGFLRKDGSCKCPECGEYDCLDVVDEELEE